MTKTILIIVLAAGFMTTIEKKQTNKHFWEERRTNSDSQSIWKLWTDVASWKEWDSGLSDAIMEEDFGLKAKGVIISLEGRKSKFKVVEYTEGKSYTIRTGLPLGALNVRRFLEEEGGQVVFTHEVWFTGISSSIFAKVFGGKFRSMLPGVLEKIKEIVES